MIQKVSLICLKIVKQGAYEYAVIATRGFCARRHSYGNTSPIKFEILCPTNEDSILKYHSRMQGYDLISLRIAKQVAHRLVIIVRQGFCVSQKLYGFRAT